MTASNSNTQRSHEAAPSAAPSAVLQVDNISLRYGGQNGNYALNNVNFTVEPASLTAIIGPNGAGKSSLVRVICGRAAAQTGTIKIAQHHSHLPSARAALGVAPQRAALYDYLSTEENLICFARQSGMTHAFAEQRVETVLDLIGMGAFRKIRANRLSGGMRQRVNIGAAIMHEPALLVLDEPAASLDPDGITQINSLITRLKQSGYGVLLVTHDMEQAAMLADQVMILVDGRTIAAGTPADLIETLCGNSRSLSINGNAGDAAKLSALGFETISQEGALSRWQCTLGQDQQSAHILAQLSDAGIDPDRITIKKPDLQNALSNAVQTAKSPARERA